MVPHIEELGAKLQIVILSELGVLHERQIPVVDTRGVKNTDAGISVSIRVRAGKCCRVEPFLRASLATGQYTITNTIGMYRTASGVRNIAADGWRDCLSSR